MPVRELQNRLTSMEFSELIAYFSIEAEQWKEPKKEPEDLQTKILLAFGFRGDELEKFEED